MAKSLIADKRKAQEFSVHLMNFLAASAPNAFKWQASFTCSSFHVSEFQATKLPELGQLSFHESVTCLGHPNTFTMESQGSPGLQTHVSDTDPRDVRFPTIPSQYYYVSHLDPLILCTLQKAD